MCRLSWLLSNGDLLLLFEKLMRGLSNKRSLKLFLIG